MSELDFDQSIIDQAMGQADPEQLQRAGGNPRFRGDETLYVRFFHHPHHDPEASAEQGRPIYRDREYVEIIVPGDKTTSVFRPVRDLDKQRFPRQYQAFRNSESQVNFGTPLEAWTGITRAQAEELKYFKIYTVEQLANLNDGIAQRFMGMNSLRTRAKDFLEAAKGESQVSALRAEIEKRDAEMAAMAESIRDLQSIVAEARGKKGKVTREAITPEPSDEPLLDTEDR